MFSQLDNILFHKVCTRCDTQGVHKIHNSKSYKLKTYTNKYDVKFMLHVNISINNKK